MHNRLKTILVASVLIGGLAATPALYAHESSGSKRPMMGPGMMGQGGMMGMMGQMSEMMETCNKMMQGMMEGHHPQSPGEKSPDEAPAK